jgi:hypothetical protein
VDPSGRFVVLTLSDPYVIDQWRLAVLDTIASATFLEQRSLLVDRRASAAPTSAFVDAMIQFFRAIVLNLPMCAPQCRSR